MLPICFHWELHNFFGTDRGHIVHAFVKNAARAESPDLGFWVLDPVDALIHAALHLITHHSRDMRLIWIYDIALLSQGLEAPRDWERLQDRSVKLGGRISIERALKLAQVVIGFQIPLGFGDFSSWPKPGETEITSMANAMIRYRPFTRLKLRLSSCYSSRQKAMFIFKFLIPDPDLMRMSRHYSDGTPLFFSYFRRWGRWVGEIMRFVLGLKPS